LTNYLAAGNQAALKSNINVVKAD